ncbi:MAG: NAD(P)-dependent oxidoreductase [Chloroflexota bacterium]|nr:NAD(P)-dependent oxidoreductase [Chloroflexota bacterium]
MATRITVLGTGRMGSALARRLAGAGFELTLWDRTTDRAKAVGLGRIAASPADAVADAEFVISSLTGPDALRATYLGPGGALEGAHGQLFLEMSTAGPDFEAELAPHLVSTGSHLVDATIVGAPPIVEHGEAAILAGGEASDVERSRPVLGQFGTVRHVGPPGNGARLKLIANSMLAQIMAGAAELQNAGETAGLDPGDVFWVLARFAPTLETRRPAYVDNELQPTMFALHDLRKDLDLALGLFHAEDAPAPMTAIARELVSQALGEFSDNDIGAIVRLYRRPERTGAVAR